MDHLLFTPLFILICIIISAFFSCSETGLTAVSRAKIHRLVQDGNKRAIEVQQLRAHKDQLIGALLFGNNVVNIAGSAIATGFSISLFGEQGILIATGVMTVLIIIFGEMIPKSYAFSRSDTVALAVAPTMRIIVKILYPITYAAQIVVNACMRMIGINPKDIAHQSYDVEALRGAIELSHHEGSVIKRDRDMLGGILDLGDMAVCDVMIHRTHMHTVDIGLDQQIIIQSILEGEYSRIPVYEGDPDNIIGILHVKALLSAMKRSPNEAINLRSLMTEPWFIPDTTLLINQLTEFRQRRSHFALVVDEYGDLMGLVTLEDILEEIVGHIEDETDHIVQGIWRTRDGSYRIHGDISVRDINRKLEWNLPDEHATSIAGLLIHEAKNIPEQGGVIMCHGFEFQVLKKVQNQLTLIKVRKLDLPE